MNTRNLGNEFITFTIVVIDFGKYDIALSLHSILQGRCHRSTLLVPTTQQEEPSRMVRLQQQIRCSDLTVIFSRGSDDYITELLGVTRDDNQYWININQGSGIDDTGKVTGTFIRRIGVNHLARRMNDLPWLLDTFCNLAQYQ